MYYDEYKRWCRREQTGEGMGFDDWVKYWQEEIQIADQANPTQAHNQGHGMNNVHEQEIDQQTAEFDGVMKMFIAKHWQEQENHEAQLNSSMRVLEEYREQINVLTKRLNQQETTTPQQQTKPPEMNNTDPAITVMNQMPVAQMQQQQFGYQS